METVSEVSQSAPAEAAGEAMDTVGEMPPPTGVRRLKSSASIRAKPSRSNGVQRTTSMRSQRTGAPGGQARGVRRIPSRKTSSNSLRPYSGHSTGHGLHRGESDMSLGDVSSGSVFTMDSVALRKGQLVADPVDGGTYFEGDSFADHESFATRDDFVQLAEAKAPEGNVVAMSDFVNLKMRQIIPESEVEDDTVSYMTGTSALTTDFTDMHDESEYEETERDCAE